ncbi:hypothetical protein [Oceanobacillus chungangensis]|uniref:Uncharacterized protein n=1 Tax=Oceanobacillus chungangensis TaxID=1229152 RepID=A0A3D8PIS5_9BACI|nr:hypothetical protein [Oceanobacillus chungangensis]RDW15954.1 hypothetical protein CWR45_15780 [Oceanobacillus chungangensis]
MDIDDIRKQLDRVIDTSSLSDDEVLSIYQVDQKQRQIHFENRLKKALRVGDGKKRKLQKKLIRL